MLQRSPWNPMLVLRLLTIALLVAAVMVPGVEARCPQPPQDCAAKIAELVGIEWP